MLVGRRQWKRLVLGIHLHRLAASTEELDGRQQKQFVETLPQHAGSHEATILSLFLFFFLSLFLVVCPSLCCCLFRAPRLTIARSLWQRLRTFLPTNPAGTRLASRTAPETMQHRLCFLDEERLVCGVAVQPAFPPGGPLGSEESHPCFHRHGLPESERAGFAQGRKRTVGAASNRRR